MLVHQTNFHFFLFRNVDLKSRRCSGCAAVVDDGFNRCGAFCLAWIFIFIRYFKRMYHYWCLSNVSFTITHGYDRHRPTRCSANRIKEGEREREKREWERREKVRLSVSESTTETVVLVLYKPELNFIQLSLPVERSCGTQRCVVQHKFTARAHSLLFIYLIFYFGLCLRNIVDGGASPLPFPFVNAVAVAAVVIFVVTTVVDSPQNLKSFRIILWELR